MTLMFIAVAAVILAMGALAWRASTHLLDLPGAAWPSLEHDPEKWGPVFG